METEEILSQFDPVQENLLPVLHKIQEASGTNHIGSETIKRVASWLKVPVSTVYGVITYYSMFGLSPRGSHVIRICRSVVCRMLGQEDIKVAVESFVKKSHLGGSSKKDLFFVEETECLGQCESAPVMMIDEEVYGDITPENIKDVIKEFKK